MKHAITFFLLLLAFTSTGNSAASFADRGILASEILCADEGDQDDQDEGDKGDKGTDEGTKPSEDDEEPDCE